MPRYRIYQFDLKGHVKAARIVDCTSDEEAVSASVPFQTAPSIEVWLGSRCIRRTSLRAIPRQASRMRWPRA